MKLSSILLCLLFLLPAASLAQPSAASEPAPAASHAMTTLPPVDQALFEELLPRIAAEAEVRRRIGAPLHLPEQDIEGRVLLTGPGDDGHARLGFVVTGPAGRVFVELTAARTNGT
jgi:hypothetical protein